MLMMMIQTYFGNAVKCVLVCSKNKFIISFHNESKLAQATKIRINVQIEEL